MVRRSISEILLFILYTTLPSEHVRVTTVYLEEWLRNKIRGQAHVNNVQLITITVGTIGQEQICSCIDLYLYPTLEP